MNDPNQEPTMNATARDQLETVELYLLENNLVAETCRRQELVEDSDELAREVCETIDRVHPRSWDDGSLEATIEEIIADWCEDLDEVAAATSKREV